MNLNLIRKTQTGKAVRGHITIPFERESKVYPTLENADYLIPDGTYPLRLTWSPKFKKMMPEIGDVPEREGIRMHLGSRPEHSEGCILLNAEGLEGIKIFINYFNKWYDEPLSITINSAEQA